MSRFSSIITEELTKEALARDSEKQFDTQVIMEQIQSRAATILNILIASKDFQQTFMCNEVDQLHLFNHSSKRIIVLDVLTRCGMDQVANIDSYTFTAHPAFEKKITNYTHSTEKPNPVLSKYRPWDIALNVILKVEALDAAITCLPTSRLLFREYNIIKYIWEFYLREGMDLDEMTGIPMVFEYTEVPNLEYNYERMVEYKVIDVHGAMIPWKSDDLTALSYMSMEKMGPNLKYLQDLMLQTKRKNRTFDLDTGFKIFDQLLCRCLQLHRFGVVHNCIEPRNIYFGRSVAFNVIYLGNYSKAMIMDSKDRRFADVYFGGDARYCSQFRARGAPAYPMQDLESAFYTLLSMIVSNLPWDSCLAKTETTPRTSDRAGRTSERPVSGENLNTSNQEIPEEANASSKVREIKSGFWKSPSGINRVLADVRYLTIGSESVHINLATEIIKDLYSRLRDFMQSIGSRSKLNFTNLMSQQTSEYQFYFELRRTTLLFFRFESISVSLCTPTYQKKIEATARDEQEPRVGWNLSNWCFNVVQMNAPGNMRLSMLPVQSVARTTG